MAVPLSRSSIVRYSRLIRSLYRRRRISRAVFGSSFSRAVSDPLASSSSFVPRVRLPHRRHLSPARVVIASLSSRPSSRPGVEHGVAKSSVSCRPLVVDKQAGWRTSGAVSSMSSMSSMSSARARSSSPGVSSHRSERAGRCHLCRGQVSRRRRVLAGCAGASRLCPLEEHQFDIWMSQGSHHPRVPIAFSC